MSFRILSTGILLAATLVVTAACSAEQAAPGAGDGGPTVFADDAVEGAIGELPHESVAPMPDARLADGLVPPTNRWFSGLVFGEVPEPVYPLPLAFSLTGTGFEFGVPPVQTGADSIGSGPSADVSASFDAAVTPTVVAYDDASVTIELADAGGDVLGAVTIAQGSPIVSFTAETDATIALSAQPAAADRSGLYTTEVAGQAYGLLTERAVEGGVITVERGQAVTWLAVPTGGDAEDLAASAHAITGVEGTYRNDGEAATTTLSYGAADAEETLIAALPHQYASLVAPDAAACDLGTYESVYGTMHLCSGRELAWTAPLMEHSGALSLGGVDETDRATIRAQLAADVELPAELPDDTYFGGKALYRLANLLQLAVQLDDAESAEIARARLTDALTDWTTPDRCETQSTRCFVYDPVVKGIVGKVSAFGSDEFNDHHFHYGYLLYAASVAVAHDPALEDRLRPVMDLVAADLATDGDSSFFPTRRTFDSYAGHSWASGYVPFRDGNNQESSSEAVAAWNGLALWADVTDNAALAEEARWMLASEAATAQEYWLGFDATDPVYDGYEHSVVALNWGSKRDYSTWFSAEPGAMLGIQLIPMTPASDYLAGDPERISENLAEGAPGGYGAQFGDYLLMYAGLRGPDAAREAFDEALADDSLPIDDANSRSYVLAFLAARAAA